MWQTASLVTQEDTRSNNIISAAPPLSRVLMMYPPAYCCLLRYLSFNDHLSCMWTCYSLQSAAIRRESMSRDITKHAQRFVITSFDPWWSWPARKASGDPVHWMRQSQWYHTHRYPCHWPSQREWQQLQHKHIDMLNCEWRYPIGALWTMGSSLRSLEVKSLQSSTKYSSYNGAWLHLQLRNITSLAELACSTARQAQRMHHTITFVTARSYHWSLVGYPTLPYHHGSLTYDWNVAIGFAITTTEDKHRWSQQAQQ